MHFVRAYLWVAYSFQKFTSVQSPIFAAAFRAETLKLRGVLQAPTPVYNGEADQSVLEEKERACRGAILLDRCAAGAEGSVRRIHFRPASPTEYRDAISDFKAAFPHVQARYLYLSDDKERRELPYHFFESYGYRIVAAVDFKTKVISLLYIARNDTTPNPRDGALALYSYLVTAALAGESTTK